MAGQCDNINEARGPDIILVDKKENSCMIVDIAVRGVRKVHEKELEKIEKYQELHREIGALGSGTKHFGKWMEKLRMPGNAGDTCPVCPWSFVMTRLAGVETAIITARAYAEKVYMTLI